MRPERHKTVRQMLVRNLLFWGAVAAACFAWGYLWYEGFKTF